MVETPQKGGQNCIAINAQSLLPFTGSDHNGFSAVIQGRAFLMSLYSFVMAECNVFIITTWPELISPDIRDILLPVRFICSEENRNTQTA
jgi:hypothetical protein